MYSKYFRICLALRIWRWVFWIKYSSHEVTLHSYLWWWRFCAGLETNKSAQNCISFSKSNYCIILYILHPYQLLDKICFCFLNFSKLISPWSCFLVHQKTIFNLLVILSFFPVSSSVLASHLLMILLSLLWAYILNVSWFSFSPSTLYFLSYVICKKTWS